MRIAIDARELVGKPTGVGRYLWQLLLAWNEIPAAAAHEFVLCTDQSRGLDEARATGVHGEDEARAAALSNLRVEHRHRARFGGTLWEQLSLPLIASDANVLFAPAYSGPLAMKVPMVLTIHDVSFAAHPEWFAWREGIRRRLLTRVSARRAAG